MEVGESAATALIPPISVLAIVFYLTSRASTQAPSRWSLDSLNSFLSSSVIQYATVRKRSLSFLFYSPFLYLDPFLFKWSIVVVIIVQQCREEALRNLYLSIYRGKVRTEVIAVWMPIHHHHVQRIR